MKDSVKRLWLKIREPRTVSIAMFLAYVTMLFAGITVLFDPPGTLQGLIGSVSMTSLAILLVLGGGIGSIAALPGIYWLEMHAVLSIGLASAIYLFIVLTLHFTTGGNRLLQASFVVAVMLGLFARWVRLRERPYSPNRPLKVVYPDIEEALDHITR